MNSNQKYSPKYWIVHDISTDDVFLHTASKTRSRAIQKHEDLYGCFAEDLNTRCSLFELKLVEE